MDLRRRLAEAAAAAGPPADGVGVASGRRLDDQAVGGGAPVGGQPVRAAGPDSRGSVIEQLGYVFGGGGAVAAAAASDEVIKVAADARCQRISPLEMPVTGEALYYVTLGGKCLHLVRVSEFVHEVGHEAKVTVAFDNDLDWGVDNRVCHGW